VASRVKNKFGLNALLSRRPSMMRAIRLSILFRAALVGLTLAACASPPTERQSFERNTATVSMVAPGSDAANKGMIAGDRIVEIDTLPISDAKQALAVLENKRNLKQSVLILVFRGTEKIFFPLDLSKKDGGLSIVDHR
jgi:S1-C subfamily serine protease